ncbi:MAG: hypothetical protein AABZ53_16255 [Planctomycetota bacterium]
MDDPREVAGGILKVAGAFCVAGIGGYFWGAIVAATPFRVLVKIARLVRASADSLVHSPELGARLWRSVAFLGIALSTTLGFWVHTTFYRSFLNQGKASTAAMAAPQPAAQTSNKLFSGFVPEVAWTSPTDGPTALVCILLFMPMLGMHVVTFRQKFRLSTEDEVENHFSFAAVALALSLGIHAALFYTPLGGLVFQGLNALTNPGMYLGIVLAVIVMEWGWGLLTKRT